MCFGMKSILKSNCYHTPSVNLITRMFGNVVQIALPQNLKKKILKMKKKLYFQMVLM
jgi:hypothetical protein